jgi:RNA polymerase sigma factor (sigma-70 family)
MDEEIDPAIAARLSGEWPTIERALAITAFRFCGARDVADDLVQEASFRLLRGKRRWDPERHPDLKAYAIGVMRSILKSWRKSSRAKHETAFVDERDRYAPAQTPNPEQAGERKEDVQDWELLLEEVRAELPPGSVAARLLECFVAEIDDVEDQAATLGVTKAEVYAARSQLKRVKRRIERKARRKALGIGALDEPEEGDV